MTLVSRNFGPTITELPGGSSLPPPKGLQDLPEMKLPPPTSLPKIRSNLTDSIRENKGTSAVLLGIAAIPAISMSFFTGTAAEAQPIVRDTAAAERIAANVLTERASARAATRAQDPHERELIQKLGRLVQRNFNGSYQAAFNHYAGADGQVSRDELRQLLGDAGIGNFITRGAWVDGIMERIDGPPNGNNNGLINWGEFQRVVNR